MLVVNNPLANAENVREVGSIPRSGSFPGGGHGNPLQYSCLENPTGRGDWWATVHRVTKSWTWLKQLSTAQHRWSQNYVLPLRVKTPIREQRNFCKRRICIWFLKAEWVKSLSCVRLFATPWTVACQAPPSMGFSRQEYWIGLPFPSPGDLPDAGIKPGSPPLQADTLTSEPPGKPFWRLHFKNED